MLCFTAYPRVESIDSEAGEHYLSRPRCQVCPTACIKFEPPPFIGILGKQKKAMESPMVMGWLLYSWVVLVVVVFGCGCCSEMLHKKDWFSSLRTVC